METSTEAPTGEPEVLVVCSFCQKPTTDVGTMVAGPGVFICDSCVALCVEIIEKKATVKAELAGWADRLSDDDLLATLPKFMAASTQVDRQLAMYVRQARSRGITWTRIGAAMGMTRQSAWERFSGEE
jgi:hypothetical protein